MSHSLTKINARLRKCPTHKPRSTMKAVSTPNTFRAFMAGMGSFGGAHGVVPAIASHSKHTENPGRGMRRVLWASSRRGTYSQAIHGDLK